MVSDVKKHFATHTESLKLVEAADDISAGMATYQNSNSASSLDEILDVVTDNARGNRIERLAKFMGNTSPQHNEETLEKVMERLVFNEDGSKAPVEEFSKRLYAIYGAVLTGHPVTSKTVEEGRAIADAAHARASGAGLKDVSRADNAVIEAANIPFKKPVLDAESANSIETIRSIREAKAKMVQTAMKVGQKHYADDWIKVNYMPTTVATWIPFDWDGRTDVEPQDIMHRRIELQTLMLGEYQDRFSALRDMLQDSDDKSVVQNLIERIEATRQNMLEHQGFFADYAQENDPESKNLSELYEKFKADAQWRLTDPQDLINPINEIIKETEDTPTLKKLVHLRSDLTNDGLSYAQIHFRLNAKSLSSALGEHGMNIDPNTKDPKQVDERYFDDLSDMVDNAEVKDSNLVDVMNAQQTVVKQMGMIREFDDYIEQGSNVRFLIAETDKAITPLIALYFAKQFGIEDKISISGLCEDRDGQNEFKRLSGLLLTNESYRGHILKPRTNHPFEMSREADQFGFSDSHRYDGAIAAGAHMERAMGQKVKVLEGADTHALIHLVNFGTGGQSMNRGFHSLGPAGDAQYKIGPTVLNRAHENDVKMTLETSFQGMDGNIYMLNPDMAFSYMTQTVDYLTDHKLHAKLSSDPFYQKDGLRQDAYEFFETVRNTHEDLVNKRGYAELIDQFMRSVLPTGSRPVKRPKDSGGERDLPRAIQHGGTLSRLSMWSTVLDGIAASINQNPKRFDRLLESDVFKNNFMTTVQRALKETQSHVVRAEIELYNPKFWEARAKEAQKTNQDLNVKIFQTNKPQESAEDRVQRYKNIATHMDRIGIYAGMNSVVEQMEHNVSQLEQRFEDKGMLAQRDQKVDADKNFLHGARIYGMMSVFERAMDIPELDEDRHDMTRDDVINRIFMFDQTVIEELKNDVFKNHVKDGYSNLHKEILGPIEEDLSLVQDESAQALVDYNSGVG